MMTLKETILYLLKVGPISPPVFLSVMECYGHKRRDIQREFQIGLERGDWHLNQDMNLTIGPPAWMD